MTKSISKNMKSLKKANDDQKNTAKKIAELQEHYDELGIRIEQLANEEFVRIYSEKKMNGDELINLLNAFQTGNLMIQLDYDDKDDGTDPDEDSDTELLSSVDEDDESGTYVAGASIKESLADAYDSEANAISVDEDLYEYGYEDADGRRS